MSHILCGKCKKYHDSILGVRECYGLAPGRNIQIHVVQDPAEEYVPARALSGEPMDDEPYHTPPFLAAPSPGAYGGAVSEAPAPRRTPVASDGYFGRDGTIYKVQESQSSGRLYAKRLVVPADTGKGVFEYAPGAIRLLTEEDRLGYAEAIEFGKLYGVCCICGRTLTNEESIAAGIGPVCSSKQGWS